MTEREEPANEGRIWPLLGLRGGASEDGFRIWWMDRVGGNSWDQSLNEFQDDLAWALNLAGKGQDHTSSNLGRYGIPRCPKSFLQKEAPKSILHRITDCPGQV